VPVAILINSQTTGAAEALAAVLRDTSVGLLIGSTTAGQASVFKEFSLANGEKLRIATSQIKLGSNKVLGQGLKPDIEVQASLADEKAYLEDAYRVLHKPEMTATNRSETNLVNGASTNQIRRRFNEAELVRQQREGVESEQSELAGKPFRGDPSQPLITDPALARAVDLLKGLAVVQQSRPG
jgi:C-terminal processing protease CtpA/Prc